MKDALSTLVYTDTYHQNGTSIRTRIHSKSASISSRISEEDSTTNNSYLQNDVLGGVFDCEFDDEPDLFLEAELKERESLDHEKEIIEIDNFRLLSNSDRFEAADCISIIQQGFENGLKPVLASEGTGGTYFLQDPCKRRFAVLKPSDEEAFAPNNPRGYTGAMGQPSMRQGILSGEACLREAAAYLIDSCQKYIGVPFTFTVHIRHPSLNHAAAADGRTKMKKASLQRFVHFDEMAGDLSHRLFPVDQVHRIGILDIRMVNTDRNDGNILIQRTETSLRLIPIDHGYCLPDTLEIAWCDWIWLDWRQSKQSFSQETREYIAGIDIDKDVEMLRESLGIREECLLNMRINSMLLKNGSAAGLTLNQIAKIICRDNLDAPSLLEMIIAQSKVIAKNRVEEKRISESEYESEFMGMLDSLMNDLVVRKSNQPSSYQVRKGIDRLDPCMPPLVLPSASLRPGPVVPAQTAPLTPGTSSPVAENVDFLDPRWLNMRMSI